MTASEISVATSSCATPAMVWKTPGPLRWSRRTPHHPAERARALLPVSVFDRLPVRCIPRRTAALYCPRRVRCPSSQNPRCLRAPRRVARVAGVRRAAVSNRWRRHETFPAPIGGTGASPLFPLAKSEAWLHRERKIKAAVEPLKRLWPGYEALAGRDAMGLLVAQVGLRLCGEPRGRPTALRPRQGCSTLIGTPRGRPNLSCTFATSPHPRCRDPKH